MLTRSISQQDFLALAERDESHFFDLKSQKITPAKLLRSVVAFANADGGTVLVGIKDKQDAPDRAGAWDGFLDLEAMNGVLQSISSCTPTIPASLLALTCPTHPGYLLRIEIEKSPDVCKTPSNDVFVRSGAQSLKLSDPQKIQELAFAKGASTFEDHVVINTPTEVLVDAVEIKNFLVEQKPSLDPLEFVINQNLVDFRTWEPRVAGLLLFHSSPSSVVPRRCGVKISRYDTREEDPERDHLSEQYSVEGPLRIQIHDAVSRVTDMMSKVAVWTSEGIRKNLSYPPEAIWETIANAVIHRDYSISDDIQILIYNDRIEIHSPGKLPGLVTLSNILDARYSRNPKIVRTLSRYSDPPNKDMGEGLNTTFQKMKDFGLKQPLFSEEGNSFIVILPHTPLASPDDAIMSFLENNKTIKNSQAREITGIKSENTVKNVFYKLREEGLIEQVPGLRGRNSAWQKKV